MNKTFVTKMPKHIGAFLKASKCFVSLGINITRVSYNKAVDSHMLFIDAEGTPQQLEKAADELIAIGYLQCADDNRSIVLLEFKLKDEPGSVTAILELISAHNFNISYISSQENGTEYQLFKMGFIVDSSDKISTFIEEAKKLCNVRVIDYNHADNIYDNSFFYDTFVKELTSAMDISAESKNELFVNTNLAMQILNESGVSPYRTFESISRFSELLAASRGNNFSPRVTFHNVTDNTSNEAAAQLYIVKDSTYQLIDGTAKNNPNFDKELRYALAACMINDFNGKTGKNSITEAMKGNVNTANEYRDNVSRIAETDAFKKALHNPVTVQDLDKMLAGRDWGAALGSAFARNKSLEAKEKLNKQNNENVNVKDKNPEANNTVVKPNIMNH